MSKRFYSLTTDCGLVVQVSQSEIENRLLHSGNLIVTTDSVKLLSAFKGEYYKKGGPTPVTVSRIETVFSENASVGANIPPIKLKGSTPAEVKTDIPIDPPIESNHICMEGIKFEGTVDVNMLTIDKLIVPNDCKPAELIITVKHLVKTDNSPSYDPDPMWGSDTNRGIEHKFCINDAVVVYDRYRFAVPLSATVKQLSSAPYNGGVKVCLLTSNTKEWPAGAEIWVHYNQLKLSNS